MKLNSKIRPENWSIAIISMLLLFFIVLCTLSFVVLMLEFHFGIDCKYIADFIWCSTGVIIFLLSTMISLYTIWAITDSKKFRNMDSEDEEMKKKKLKIKKTNEDLKDYLESLIN